MKGTSRPVLTPLQSSPGTQVYSGSRNEISAQVKEVAGYKLVIRFFNLMGSCAGTVFRFVLVGSVQPPESVVTYTDRYCTNSSKVPCDDPQVLVECLLEIQSFCTVDGRKEIKPLFIYFGLLCLCWKSQSLFVLYIPSCITFFYFAQNGLICLAFLCLADFT